MGLNFSGEDFLGSFLVELNNKGESVARDKSNNCLLSHFTLEIITAFIKILEEGNARSFNFVFLESSCFRSYGKRIIVHGTSSSKECYGISRLDIFEKSDDSNIIIGNEGFGVLNIFQSLSRGSCLFLQPSHNSVSSSSTGVLEIFTVLVELKCWISSNIKLFSKFRLFCSINLAKLDGGVFFG